MCEVLCPENDSFKTTVLRLSGASFSVEKACIVWLYLWSRLLDQLAMIARCSAGEHARTQENTGEHARTQENTGEHARTQENTGEHRRKQ